MPKGRPKSRRDCRHCGADFMPPSNGMMFCSDDCRFWAKVDKSGDCWTWMAATRGGGYGHFVVDGRDVVATRWIYERQIGRISDGLLVCHKCDNPKCVNPDHLFLGTEADNMLDRDAKGRQRRGERTNTSKLTEEQVGDIRRSDEPYEALAGRYGVTADAIYKARVGITWGHLPGATAETDDLQRKARGSDNGFAKLTEADVRAIRRAEGKYDDIGARFGIRKSHVGRIKRREAWAHVAD